MNMSGAPLLGQGDCPHREKLTCEPTWSGRTFCMSAVAHWAQWLAGRRNQENRTQAFSFHPAPKFVHDGFLLQSVVCLHVCLLNQPVY